MRVCGYSLGRELIHVSGVENIMASGKVAGGITIGGGCMAMGAGWISIGGGCMSISTGSSLGHTSTEGGGQLGGCMGDTDPGGVQTWGPRGDGLVPSKGEKA